MINKKELRVGNLIQWGMLDGEPMYVEIYEGDDIEFHGVERGSAGIKLMVEMFEKIGFNNLHGEYCEELEKDPLHITFIPDGTIEARLMMFEGDSWYIKLVESIHEIQNLYFALTGIELNIQPLKRKICNQVELT